MQKRIDAYYTRLGETFFGSRSSVEVALKLCDLYGFDLDELITELICLNYVELKDGESIDPVHEVNLRAVTIAEDELLHLSVDADFSICSDESGYDIKIDPELVDEIIALDSSKFSPILKAVLEQAGLSV
ncbi:hypothetical protein [Campylobacter sp. MIT 97-5078]|uniref:hypothetical protein n=1 Tax=Campylobacter sp. MIT 97-5078 TaxID=1548153 RepID=UPI001160B667|nr:hypothetical protein [Campylobacter sp. MIT 97-5078]